MKKFCLVAFVVAQSLFVQSQQLKLEDIMKGDAYVGFQPENHRWSVDGEKVYFEWNPNKEWGNSTYFWKKGMKKPELASNDEAYFSKMRFQKGWEATTFYYLDKGVLFSYDTKTKSKKKIFQQLDGISSFVIGQEKGVLFLEQKGNFIQFNVKEGSVLQLTNFLKIKEPAKEEKETNFLKEQQKELFQFITDQEAKKIWQESKTEGLPKSTPKPLYFNKLQLVNLAVHPKGEFVTFSSYKEPEVDAEKMAVFITADGYNKTRDTKEKVSTQNIFEMKYGIYNVVKDTLYYMDFSKLSGVTQFPEYYKEYENLKKEKEKVKELYIDETLFNETGTFAVLSIRSMDNKDRWLVSVNLKDNSFSEIDHQHDEAWIAGPGIPSYSFSNGTLGFLADNQTIYFQSEKTGYSHLYTYNLNSKTNKALTTGKWEVRNVELSSDKNTFYITVNKSHPGNREFYKLGLSDGKLQPILTQDGAHEVKLSPNEQSLLVRYSYKNQPWDLYWSSNVTNAKLQPITQSQSAEFKQYNWRTPEVISFKAEDGKDVYARIYQPKAEVKNGAAVIFVHGAGYLQNAHNFWSNYVREYMFHNLLADKGYTVLDIDYRASDGYGRDHRTGIYRFMGGKDLSDQIDGKKLLVSNYGIDSKRVGIYGGSYGGFITLMALLTQPDEFKAGAALRSVTDWAHYNHGYTGNILNFPETDPEAYEKSSPIYFAENLKGNLLMLHGMVDDNVEYKDIVRLSQRFIELGKKNWSLASYPVEAHGFKETYSWIDEYGRILEHFETYLKK